MTRAVVCVPETDPPRYVDALPVLIPSSSCPALRSVRLIQSQASKKVTNVSGTVMTTLGEETRRPGSTLDVPSGK